MDILAEEVVSAIAKQYVEHWLRRCLKYAERGRQMPPSFLPAVANHIWFEHRFLGLGSYEVSDDTTFINLKFRSSRPRMHYVILENSLSGCQQRFWFDYNAYPTLGHLFDAATRHLRGKDDVTSRLVPLPTLTIRSNMRDLVDGQIPLIFKYIKQQPENWHDVDQPPRATVIRQ